MSKVNGLDLLFGICVGSAVITIIFALLLLVNGGGC